MSRHVITTAVASSVVVFIFSSTLFFILGCACSWVGHMYKTKQSDKNTHFWAAPLYEDLQPSMPTSARRPGECVLWPQRERCLWSNKIISINHDANYFQTSIIDICRIVYKSDIVLQNWWIRSWVLLIACKCITNSQEDR